MRCLATGPAPNQTLFHTYTQREGSWLVTFFDVGVRNTVAQLGLLQPKTDLYGQAFEHFIAMELRAYISYCRLNKALSYWCSTHGAEVDFIVGDEVAIEVKTTNKIHDKHLKNLRLLMEENICQKYVIVSFDKLTRKSEKVDIVHWQEFLKRLWRGAIF